MTHELKKVGIHLKYLLNFHGSLLQTLLIFGTRSETFAWSSENIRWILESLLEIVSKPSENLIFKEFPLFLLKPHSLVGYLLNWRIRNLVRTCAFTRYSLFFIIQSKTKNSHCCWSGKTSWFKRWHRCWQSFTVVWAHSIWYWSTNISKREKWRWVRC